MGLYAYPPNTQAVRFLIEEVMPRLLRARPDAQLVVTGGAVPIQRPWLINPGVVPFGEVPALLRACAIGTAPIFSGSGTRLKILECMAAGTPVVATPKGAEGIEVVDGQSILLAQEAAGFAERILWIWDDPALAETLTGQARQIARSTYDWPVCLRGLVACCDGSPSHRPGGRRQQRR
jgi:glycosyltransferase involved in cell wall biosynthesis